MIFPDAGLPVSRFFPQSGLVVVLVTGFHSIGPMAVLDSMAG